MADYTEAIKAAESALRAKGMPMVFVRVISGEYDPVTNTRPSVEIETPFYGVKTSPTVEEVQGGIFAAGSMVVLMSGNAVDHEVSTTDTLRFGGHEWDIQQIRTVAPAEQVIVYKMQVEDAGIIDEAKAGTE